MARFGSPQQQLRARAFHLGLVVATYAPGDGVTRYRFQRLETPGQLDYFAGDGLGTVLGLKAANTWLDGYAAARSAR